MSKLDPNSAEYIAEIREMVRRHEQARDERIRSAIARAKAEHGDDWASGGKGESPKCNAPGSAQPK